MEDLNYRDTKDRDTRDTKDMGDIWNMQYMGGMCQTQGAGMGRMGSWGNAEVPWGARVTGTQRMGTCGTQRT